MKAIEFHTDEQRSSVKLDGKFVRLRYYIIFLNPENKAFEPWCMDEVKAWAQENSKGFVGLGYMQSSTYTLYFRYKSDALMTYLKYA